MSFQEILNKYLEVGGKFLVAFFVKKQMKPPVSNVAWALYQMKQLGVLEDGTKYFKHGYGIDFKNEFYSISIDFGRSGQLNGFDAWRIFSFISENKIDFPAENENIIEDMLVKATQDGVVFKDDHLYYLK